MANIREIASKAGIGIATVSRYLNGTGYVSQGAGEKIQKAIDDLNYTPNALARAIFTKNTKIIGLMIPNVTNPFFNQFVLELEALFKQKGYTILLCNTDDDPIKEKEQLEILKSYRVAGIIAMRTMCPEEYFAIDIPLISFENDISGEVITVSSDNYRGAKDAFQHLYDRSCRNFLHIQGPTKFLATYDRYRGFRDAAEAKSDVQLHVVPLPTDFHSKTVEPLIAAIPNIESFDGIFVFNDITAAVVMKHLHSKGISIPDDIQVIGFDNSFIGDLLYPSLTSIHQPMKELSALMAQLLIQLINKEEVLIQNHHIPTSIVQRQSTRP